MSKKRSSDHIRAQREGRERDMYVCQICGSSNHTEGHHMIDYQYGGAADSDNIITLCHKHHRDVHNGIIDLFRF